MRLLLLLTLCAGWAACAEKSEITLVTADNDFIAGTLDGQPFHYASSSIYLTGATYEVPFTLTAGEGESGATVQYGGLAARRTDVDAVKTIALELPGIPLHTYTFPAGELAGTLAHGEFADDSYIYCPHIDSSSLDVVPVTVHITSWEGDQLIGAFRAAEPGREVTGNFRLLVARP